MLLILIQLYIFLKETHRIVEEYGAIQYLLLSEDLVIYIQYNNTHFTQVCDSSAEEVGTLAHKRCSISSVETVVGTLANSRSSIPFSAAVVGMLSNKISSMPFFSSSGGYSCKYYYYYWVQ